MWSRISLRISEDPLAAEVNADCGDDEQNDDADTGVEAVMVDRLRRRPARVVGDRTEGDCPDDPAGGIPEEEAPPGHMADSGEPRCRDAQDRHESTEEDGLRPVPLEEALGGRQDAREVVAEQRDSLEE